jgi:hypothetical protein
MNLRFNGSNRQNRRSLPPALVPAADAGPRASWVRVDDVDAKEYSPPP